MKRQLILILLLLFLTACGSVSALDPDAGEDPGTPVTILPKEDEPEEALPLRTVDPSRPMVALTFDDGPHTEYTDQILDILEEHNAVATFFEVAGKLSSAPDAVRREAELGCETGSHSYRHADLGKMDAEALQEDLSLADAAFIEVLGTAPTLLRPPYGSTSKALKTASDQAIVTWSIDPQDWKVRDAEKVLSHIQSFDSLDGQVILLHSTYETTVEAVRDLVPWLLEEGYQLVTVTELITLRFHDQVEPNRLYNFDYFRYQLPALAEDSSEMFAALPLAEGIPEDSPFTVRLVMTEGTFLPQTLGGGFGEQNYTGSCEFQVWRAGSLVSTYPLEEELLFTSGSFSLLFDDYNGDGLPDFTLGQWLSSNLDAFSIFTLEPDGTIRPISTPFAIAASKSDTPYSIRFDRVEGGFTVPAYDNASGRERQTDYLWDGTTGLFVPVTHET